MENTIQSIIAAGLMVAMVGFSACKDDAPDVPNSQPTIDVGADKVGMTDVSLDIDVVAVDPDGNALTFTWTIIDSPTGSSATLVNSSDLRATFETSLAGLYKVEIVVDDNNGGTNSGIVTLYIGGVLPTSIDNNTSYPDIFVDSDYPDYYALGDLNATAGVTFEAGVIVESAADVRLWFNGSSGYIKAIGTSANRIIFRGMDKVKGSWRAISISSNNVNNSFSFVDIMHTGSSAQFIGQATAIYLQSNTSAKVSIRNTSISLSAGYALFTDGNNGVLTEFSNNNFSDNDKAPVRIGGESLYALDKNSVFTGNGIQAIEVSSAGNTNATFENPGTIPALAIPYHVYSSLELRATVTFEAGATCLFESGKRLWITSEGAIVADGTATDKIVFSGLSQSPGAWFGFEFQSPSTLNLLNNTEVSYGGDTGGRGANIYMFGSSPGSKLTLTNSIITNSATYGLRAASGNAALTESGNTFNSNASGDIRQD
ncbi:MAG: hypothetical protein ACI9XJ_000430 [Marivirga sp.]|jgi:hypothetical protein